MSSADVWRTGSAWPTTWRQPCRWPTARLYHENTCRPALPSLPYVSRKTVRQQAAAEIRPRHKNIERPNDWNAVHGSCTAGPPTLPAARWLESGSAQRLPQREFHRRQLDQRGDRRTPLASFAAEIGEVGANAIKPRALSARGSEVTFADSSRSAIDAVVWTVGYEGDARWIDIAEAKDGDGGILGEDGRSPVPGLYHLGRPWQRNRASALIMGAGPDAKLVVDHLLARGTA